MTAVGWMYLTGVALVAGAVFGEPVADLLADGRDTVIEWWISRHLPTSHVEQPAALTWSQADAWDAIARANPDLAAIDWRQVAATIPIPSEEQQP